MIPAAVSPQAPPTAPFALVQDGGRFLLFEAPLAELVARDAADVRAVLAEADTALAAGRFVAGYLAYEAAAAFGFATRSPDPDGPPLVWLGVFEAPREAEPPRAEPGGPVPAARWEPALDAAGHADALVRIHERLASGDTYQVNFTFPLRAPLAEDPLALFGRLLAAQQPRHAALVDLGRFAVVCASPELFFRREGGRLTTRPMKGTAARGVTPEEDEAQAAALRESEKERAENLMIVDMLRNDLGQVAEVGSVEAPALFEVERYPTVLQMTSTVTARSRAPLSALMAALFPCASVTGAPKKRTMEIVAEAETSPRGVYTGAVGWAGPDGTATFAVAIRTVLADRERGLASFGVGSGVVADSVAEREYEECLLKARILDEPAFALLETMAFHPGEGYRRLEGHLARLARSARHFGYPLDMRRVEEALRDVAVRGAAVRARLLLHPDGRVEVQPGALPPAATRPLRVGISARPVDPRSVWLHHKTTRREIYDEAVASRPDCDDVLLWNDRGELTESCVANVIVEIGGQRLTPPLGCGLLPGVERARAIAEGRAREAVVRLGDLRPGQRLWLVSSLRGVREARLVG
jgi:para-aminobenzoate synthetase/4-amino-4-deoxychorismate lyase